MVMAGKAAPWSEKSTGEHVLDEATMVALCLGHDLARLVTLAVQVLCARSPLYMRQASERCFYR